MIKIEEQIWQWDTDLTVEVDSLCEVHFAAVGSSEALVVESKEIEGKYLAAIPNILLQECKDIFIYVMRDDDTQESKRVSIIARAKPDDYVYTETEIKNYEDFEERLSALEGEEQSLPIASTSTLGGIKVGENLTIADDGTLAAPYSAKGDKGDKGDKGEPGQDGADGYTPVRGVDYWTSADIATIQDYIDENISESGSGSYTLPVASSTTLGGIKVGDNLSITSDGVLSANSSSSGGGGSAVEVQPFRYINSYKYVEGSTAIVSSITQDSTGAAFQLKKVLVLGHISSSNLNNLLVIPRILDTDGTIVSGSQGVYNVQPYINPRDAVIIEIDEEQKILRVDTFAQRNNQAFFPISGTEPSYSYIQCMVGADEDVSVAKYINRIQLAATGNSPTNYTKLGEGDYVDIFGVDA